MNARFDACLITFIDYEINLQIAQALSVDGDNRPVVILMNAVTAQVKAVQISKQSRV